jgi:hypothetical protein
MDKYTPKDFYWASIKNEDEFLDELSYKIKNYHDDLRKMGLLELWDRAYRLYYNGKTSGNDGMWKPLFDDAKLNTEGKKGEKTTVKINHHRNFLNHIHQLVTSQRIATQARAANTDFKSQAQAILANGLVDSYNREKYQERYLIDSAEIAISLYGEAFIHMPWNPSIGKIIATESVEVDGEMVNSPIYEGDQEYFVLSPLEVIRDPSIKNQKHSWNIVKSQANRWDLVQKYKKQAEKILECTPSSQNPEDLPSFKIRNGEDPLNDDIVDIYTFYHDKTEAMPQGRITIFLRNVILFDGPNSYRRTPVYRFAGRNLHETIYGYTIAYDLMPIQEAIDELHTILMTNNKTFGIPNIWTDPNDSISVTSLGGGLRHIKSMTKPEPVNLTASAPETYNYLQILENSGEKISAVSATVRGEPESSLKSGNALALVVSQSIQFMSSLEESFHRLIEDTATGLIHNLSDFSNSERVATIAGVSSRPFMKTFKAEDLSQISRIVVEKVNPLSKTIAGRTEIANNLMQQGLIESPQQYLSVLTTGNLDVAIEGTEHELLNIRAENEELREKRPVLAVVVENHALHIKEHKAILASPEAKQDPELVQIVLAHIQEHIDVWRNADPAILMVTGQQPPPPPPMPMGQPGLPPAPAPQQGGVNPEMVDATNPVNQEAQNVNLPNMPSLPPGAPAEAQQAYDKINPGS